MRKKVLVTGAAGLMGKSITPMLAQSFDLVLTDREEGDVAGMPVYALDITDYKAVAAMMEGIDAVIHLAIASTRHVVTDIPKFDTDDGEEYLIFNQIAVDVNMRGTYNILEAARQKGCKRVVIGSSLTVLIGNPRRDHFYDEMELRPVNFYAVTKMFCENLGEFFHRRHGLEVFALRFGTPYPQPLEPKAATWAKGPLGRRTFISFADLADAMAAAVNAPWVKYAPCTVVSREPDLAYSLATTKEVLGWEPADFFDAEGKLVPRTGVEA